MQLNVHFSTKDLEIMSMIPFSIKNITMFRKKDVNFIRDTN